MEVYYTTLIYLRCFQLLSLGPFEFNSRILDPPPLIEHSTQQAHLFFFPPQSSLPNLQTFLQHSFKFAEAIWPPGHIQRVPKVVEI
jgi:hypothetical protein